MLDPTVIANAIVSTFQTIVPLVAAMGSDPSKIAAFHFLYGSNVPLRTAIAQMESPSVLVAWERSGPGRLNPMTLWQHEFDAYFRIANQAGLESPVGPATVWQNMMNSPVNAGTLNFRKVSILPNLYLVNTPTVEHRVDENGLDYFCGHLVFPEIGDA